MSQWWRAYNSSLDNAKLLKLSDAMHRAWYTLQCVASENDGTLPPADDIAARLRVKPAKVAEWITKLVQAKLIDNVDGVFAPHNWDTRQYKSDVTDPTAAKRQKRYRDNKRNDRNATVTVKRPEAETEAETEQSRADASAPIDEDLKKKATALRAGIGAMFQSRGWPVPNLDRAAFWLAQGFSAGTVLGAVEAVLKRGKPISTADYFDGAINDAHANAPPTSPLIDTMAGWFLIIQGTLEETCWQQYSREKTGKPMFICKQLHEGREVMGTKKPTLFPPGYDEATGERIAPSSDQEENAA